MSIASYIFDMKIDADCGLCVMGVTLSPSSNLSLIYFSMMDDFPTAISPRKMILYLVLPPPMVLEDTLIIIINKLSEFESVFYF